MDIFGGAQKSSLLYKVYEKRNRNNTCFLLKRNVRFGHLMNMKNLDRVFFLIADVAADFAPKIIQAMGTKNTFTYLKPIYESVRTLIRRKNLKKEFADYLDFCIDFYLSLGIFQKGVSGFADFQSHAMPKTGKDGFVNYYHLSDYIEDHSLVVPLTFYQLDYLFRIYGSILILLAALNMGHYAQARLVDHTKGLLVFPAIWLRLFSRWQVHPASQ